MSISEQTHVCLQPHILQSLHTQPLKLSFLKKLSTATSGFNSTSATSQTSLLFSPLFARSLSFSLHLFCPMLLKQAYPAFVSKSWWNCPMVYSWSSGLDFEIRAGHGDVCIPLVSSEWVQETTLINGQDCTGLSTDLPFQPISRFRRMSNGRLIGRMGTLNWLAIWSKAEKTEENNRTRCCRTRNWSWPWEWSWDPFLKVLVLSRPHLCSVLSLSQINSRFDFKISQEHNCGDIIKLPVNCLIYLLTSLVWLDVKHTASNKINYLFLIWCLLLLLCEVRI